MAESLGAVNISNIRKGLGKEGRDGTITRKNWTGKQGVRKRSQSKKLEVEYGKRNLVDVMIIDGTVEGCGLS